MKVQIRYSLSQAHILSLPRVRWLFFRTIFNIFPSQMFQSNGNIFSCKMKQVAKPQSSRLDV